MPKYLFTGSFTEQGGKGIMAEGGSKRVEAVGALFSSLGGKLESYHFGFGGDDYFIIGELPDNATAAAASMKVTLSGAVRNRTVVLLTPEELDRASGIQMTYRPPGG
ncbi:MAG TPA: GYD domain-containing protein [Candidatus Limnocylindrales bacterium]|nr:GYD domain-containing protein [Candidatus Limnocylindrales bacterium]